MRPMPKRITRRSPRRRSSNTSAQATRSLAAKHGRSEAIRRHAVRQAVAAALKDAQRGLRRHGRGLERGRAHPLRPGGARASLRAHLLLAGPQGPRHPSDPRGARQAGQERHRADGPHRPRAWRYRACRRSNISSMATARHARRRAAPKATFRCRFAEAVAGNLAGMAKEIVDGWQDGAPYAKSYLEPGPANAAYHTPKEVTLELFKTFTTGIEWVRDQKIGKDAGRKARAGKAAACALLAERSELRQHGRTILPACATCSPKAASRKWCIDDSPASRIRSSSISTTPSRCCAAWTSRSPKPCATRTFAPSSKPCASR